MKNKLLSILAVGLLCVPVAAHAGYVYTWTFDAISYEYGYGDPPVPISFESATFSFEVPVLMDYASLAGPYSVSVTGSLNGHTAMSHVEVGGQSGNALMFRDVMELDRPVNTVNGWFFYVDFGGDAAVLGTFSQYQDWGACRTISNGANGGFSLCGTGSLTISESGAPAVPEPGTLALLGLGLAGLGFVRRRKTN